MKKVYFILILMIINIAILGITVLAAGTEIKFDGNKKVEPGSTNELSVKLSSSNTIGVISGKIEVDSKLSNLKIEGKNGWNLTYNAETGDFNIYKAVGAKSEEIMKIEYKAAATEGSAKIKLTDLKSADITYTEEELRDVTETITITKVKSTGNTTAGQNTSTSNTTANNTTTERRTANTTNTSGSEGGRTINPTQESNDPTVYTGESQERRITPVVENAQVDQKLPHTGVMEVLIPAGILLVVIGGAVARYGYKKYRGV